MTKVIFKFSKEHDLKQQWSVSRIKNEKISSLYKKGFFDRTNATVFEICKDKEFRECREELDEYLTHKYYDNPIFEAILKSMKSSWRFIEKEFFRRMNKLMKNKYDLPIRAFVGTGVYSGCQHSKSIYMISIRHHIPNFLVISGHEIMHLYYRRFYGEAVINIIGTENARYLSEALTVLLNEEFKDLWIFNDKGYPQHEELRNFIVNAWREERDFEILLGKCIGYFINK